MIDYYVAYLHRLQKDSKQTLGGMVVYCGTNEVFSCKTLELPWLDNKPFISCIPPGEYTVQKRYSDTYGWHWHILDVEGRTLILIHAGNFHRDTEGCVCVGRDHRDIDNDGYKDLTSSRATMRQLNNAVPVNTFKLVVI